MRAAFWDAGGSLRYLDSFQRIVCLKHLSGVYAPLVPTNILQTACVKIKHKVDVHVISLSKSKHLDFKTSGLMLLPFRQRAGT